MLEDIVNPIILASTQKPARWTTRRIASHCIKLTTAATTINTAALSSPNLSKMESEPSWRPIINPATGTKTKPRGKPIAHPAIVNSTHRIPKRHPICPPSVFIAAIFVLLSNTLAIYTVNI
jgi:hypothetical protein